MSLDPQAATTLTDVIRRRAALTPDAQYFSLFDDVVTYERLWTMSARYAAGLAAAGLCAVWLGGLSPAQARDRISDHDVDRAKDACRQIAENRDWRDVRTDVRDRDEDRDRVIVTMRGKRNGEDRERECTYDVRDQRADFEDQDQGGGRFAGRDVERARDACRQVAENRGWRDIREDVRDERDRDRNGDRVVVTMRGKRNGEDRERECRFNARRDNADFED
jgi:hypothetical protein